eukprot:gene1029-1581_t
MSKEGLKVEKKGVAPKAAGKKSPMPASAAKPAVSKGNGTLSPTADAKAPKDALPKELKPAPKEPKPAPKETKPVKEESKRPGNGKTGGGKDAKPTLRPPGNSKPSGTNSPTQSTSSLDTPFGNKKKLSDASTASCSASKLWQPVAGSVYSIQLHSTMCPEAEPLYLAAGSDNSVVVNEFGDGNQKWEFKKVKDNAYTIRAHRHDSSFQYLSHDGYRLVDLWDEAGGQQQWSVVQKDDTFQIRTAKQTRSGASLLASSPVVKMVDLQEVGESSFQNWTIVAVKEATRAAHHDPTPAKVQKKKQPSQISAFPLSGNISVADSNQSNPIFSLSHKKKSSVIGPSAVSTAAMQRAQGQQPGESLKSSTSSHSSGKKSRRKLSGNVNGLMASHKSFGASWTLASANNSTNANSSSELADAHAGREEATSGSSGTSGNGKGAKKEGVKKKPPNNHHINRPKRTKSDPPELLAPQSARQSNGSLAAMSSPETNNTSNFRIQFDRPGSTATTGHLVGTPNYMAPEVITENKPSRASDIWSIAATIVELTTGKRPWTHDEDRVGFPLIYHIATSAQNGRTPEISPRLSAVAKQLLKACFSHKPADRPTCNQLLDHAFFDVKRQLDETEMESLDDYVSDNVALASILRTHSSDDIQTVILSATMQTITSKQMGSAKLMMHPPAKGLSEATA